MIIIVCGCVPGPLLFGEEDVSHKTKLWYGYKYKGIYELKTDMFIRQRDTNLPNKLVLVPPRAKTKKIYTLHYSAPESIEIYNNSKKQWPDIKGIVTAGTEIQCNKLIMYNAAGYGSSLYIFARILDGPFSGLEVEISDLSLVGPEDESGVYLNFPNVKLLEPRLSDS